MATKIRNFEFYKQNQSDTIWWVDDVENRGEFKFSFDRKKIYNLFTEYPHNLTAKQKEVFDQENPYWKDFFKDRQ